MKHIPILFIALIFISLLVFHGCAPKVVQLEQPGSPPSTSQMQADSEKARQAKLLEEELARKEERERALKEAMKTSLFHDILFDYDSYAIKTENIPKLNAIAQWLKQYNDVRIVVEGHCDERGTIEYNLVLGQKRAEAVKDYLEKSGIQERRIKTISYGKEMPVDPGHTEEAWAKNRRAHFRIE